MENSHSQQQGVESTTSLSNPSKENNDSSGGDVLNDSIGLNRDSLQGVELMSVDHCRNIPQTDDSHLRGNSDVVARGDGGAKAEMRSEDGVKVIEMSSGKRKRGRPPKNQAKMMSLSAPAPARRKNDEEDVCFICFDGGSLVLCDRHGCPKAYHPACVKRDDAFFKSKAKWNCGWHICSTCQKASYYMCYTCPYSLCKNCTKGADYVNVRGNKGFCGICLKTIMLSENSTLGNKEMVQVDFDDPTSWEYLFKMYWVSLKEKLSLTLDELTKAKNPWKENATMEKSFGDLGASFSKRRKNLMQRTFFSKVETVEAVKPGITKYYLGPTDTISERSEVVVTSYRKVDEKGKRTNPDEFAAIDVHNMNLIWLRRNLIENLIDDVDKFNDKIVGSFVRIRLPGNDQKQDMYRLVQVVGTSKVAEPYKIGEKTIDIMIEILNLDKKEVVSIDGISNQEFSEDECQQLRQSIIKSGQIKWFTVGEVQEKAMALQAVRVNDCLESEILRVKNLYEQASQKGDMKELRECEEKLQLLNSPDERNRRLHEIADIHSDTNKDLFFKYEEVSGELDEKKKGMELSINNTETDKIWHYQDPHEKIQGPFSMAMSRVWSTGGHFPPDSRIWRGSLNPNQNDASDHGNDDSAMGKELGSQSSTCTASINIVNSETGSCLPQKDSMKGDSYFPGQPHVSGLVPTSTLSVKPCETQSPQVSKGHGVERWDCGSIDMNVNLNKTKGQIIDGNVKQDDNEGKSGKSSGQCWRAPPLNDASNGWGSNSGLLYLARALEVSEHNQGIDFPDLPTSTSKLNQKESKIQATKSKQSPPPNVAQLDSGPSWSTASSIVGNGPQLHEVAGEWRGYSSNSAEPAGEWNPDLVPKSTMKPTDLGSDHAATPTSGSGQLTHSSATDPANNESGWDPIVPEPNEYSLGDESVSDLLAEVEAMESLNGMASPPSPTSILRCDGDLAQGSEPDCFSPVGGLSPAPDPGKSDALSSTNDLQISSLLALTNELFGITKSEDAQKSSGGHSSTSAEMDEDTRPSDVSVNQYEAWRVGHETTGTNWGAVQGNVNFHLQGLRQETMNFSWGPGHGTIQENGSSVHSSTSAGNPAYWRSQQMYVDPRDQHRHVDPRDQHRHVDPRDQQKHLDPRDQRRYPDPREQQRHVNPRDHDFHSRDSSFVRARPPWNMHSSYGGGPPNRVGSFRLPPKGQRICKFHESGYCNRGASCSYWHP
ncbi:zinc finger CCCH domain-containing protein 44-like isoform X2 [Hibiscus syriacus]|uniref:zinc finger CCCH domain-containing protein 44-like isoform X2 n=1 Tax=Hibiscus syriacus TaxID=106335 RepID=UPI001924F42E|nr:zinc finger CCCH domain-containing protein 44-like isoform X2 [Hibiscus syriacus]